ncbi:hypothetical protein LQD23_15805 [Chromobacterium violaceum]|uniref:hypothetical protein n=1 Tax=Chromobacterium violaceum TaxID=536 RepID=UPI001E588BA4|nr:hypothetical protein [Chromobacterium violaceum]MCD0493752.1 hypothetical protein [Chromobacterium violaceum]
MFGPDRAVLEKRLFDQLERTEQQRNAEAVVIGRSLLSGQRVGKVFLARHFGQSDERCNALRARWRQLMENQAQEQAQ